MEKIGICSDHAGVELKAKVKEFLLGKGLESVDFGTHTTDSCDYPDFAHKLGEAIDAGDLERGISICGSANGISMTMNKHPKVRAAICWEVEIAKLARSHNDANVCSLPARFVSEELALGVLDAFLTTEFEGGRHQTRVDKIPL
jgi:ribose 5-phosphate isomerase B